MSKKRKATSTAAATTATATATATATERQLQQQQASISTRSSSSLVLDDGSTVDLDDPATSPRDVADALLSLLPRQATTQSEAAQKLLRAFPFLRGDLEYRSSVLSRSTETAGERRPLLFRFPADGSSNNDSSSSSKVVIALPADAFLHTLQFLTGKEITTACCLVSKSWLALGRNPQAWKTLDGSSGLNNYPPRLNMKALLDLLSRPQFSLLRGLRIPGGKIKLGKTGIKQIAKICPHLEDLDLGGDSHNVKPTDGDIVQAAELLPKLRRMKYNMWHVTNAGIANAARAVGDRLLDLRINGDTITKHYLSDGALSAVASACSGLRTFSYDMSCYYYDADLDLLTHRGIVALVRGCPDLEVLNLVNATNVGLPAFEAIAELQQQQEPPAAFAAAAAAASSSTSPRRQRKLRVLRVIGESNRSNYSRSATTAIPPLLVPNGEEAARLRARLEEVCDRAIFDDRNRRFDF